VKVGDNKLAVNYLIKFVIKVLFMTPNYVTTPIMLNFTPFECLSLIYNSEDKKNKNQSDSKNLLKNVHNFSV
jgi:hypothetical protein